MIGVVQFFRFFNSFLVKKKPEKNSKKQSIIIFFIIVFLSSFFLFFANYYQPQTQEITLSDGLEYYHKGDIKEISVDGVTVNVELQNGDEMYFYKEISQPISELGIDPTQVEVKVLDKSDDGLWLDIFLSVLPLLFIVFIIVMMVRQSQGGSHSVFNFGKSKAVLFEANKKKIKFKDVAGMPEVKEELIEIVDFLKHPKKYNDMGAKIPRGVLLYGPPGTGKTLLARAVAGEAKVPFFSISGSEFVEMFVGVGASRVRDLFNKAKKESPCILFIDEIDAVGRKRGSGVGGGNDEREQTLNQILVEMDGFDNDTNVVVIAATNRPDVLDKALLRPGRFDRRVGIDMPDMKAREEILKVHAKGKPVSKNVNYEIISKKTINFSGAELMNIMNEAAILAAKIGKKTITQQLIEDAIAKVYMGPERKSRVRLEKELKNTAYHESGHAIVGANLAYSHEVYKITIVSRGNSLGTTWFMPKDDMKSRTRIQYEHEMAMALGGRVAEEIIFGKEHITTGASNDIKQVTNMARAMVVEYGMTDALGARIYDIHENQGIAERNYSEDTAKLIDDQVLIIIKKAYKLATDILVKNKDILHKMTKELLKNETLTKDEFEAILGKKQACEVSE